MKRTWKHWTPEQDAMLREEYLLTPPEIMAKKVGHTVIATRQRAQTLGLLNPRGARWTWTPEDIALVRSEYARIGARGLSKILHRSESAIQQFAAKLGVQYVVVWTAEQDALLREHYPALGASKLAVQLVGRAKHEIGRRAAELGLKFIAARNTDRRKRCGSASHFWRGFSDPSGDERFNIPSNVLTKLKRNAVTRKIRCTITLADIAAQMRRQNGICAKTGRPVSFTDGTASIDRIDSDGPYSPANIRITTIMANLCQLYYTDPEMDQFCLDYVRHKGLIPSKDAAAEEQAAAVGAATVAATEILKEAA